MPSQLLKHRQSDAKLQRREESLTGFLELFYPKHQEMVNCSSDNMKLLMNRFSMASASSNSFNHNSSKVSHQNTQWKNVSPIGNISYNDTNKSVLKDKDSSFVFDLDASDFIVNPSDYFGQQQLKCSSENMKLIMNRFSMASASSNYFNHNSSKVSHQNTPWKNVSPIGNISYKDTNKSVLKDKVSSFVFDLDASDLTVHPKDYLGQQQVKCSSDNMKLLMNRFSMASASSNSFNHNLSKVSHQNTQWKNAFPIGNISYIGTKKSVLKDKDSSFVFDLDASDFIADPSDYLGQQQVKCGSANMKLLMNRFPIASASSHSFNHNSSKASYDNMQSNDVSPIGNNSYNDTNKSVLKDKISSFLFDLDASDLTVHPKDYLGQQQKQVEDLCVFGRAIQESVESTQRLQTWDRNMGLKRCHSRRMTNSTNSRKKLKFMFQIKEKEANDDIRPLRIISPAA